MGLVNNLISWLIHTVSIEVAKSVVYCSTAHKIWKKLEQRFRKSNAAKVYQVQRDLNSLNQGNLSVTAYFTKAKRLWNEHASLLTIPSSSCGSAQAFVDLIQENVLMMKPLLGL